MPEYIQYDLKGRIIKKWYSVDPSIVEGLLNILIIPRDMFNSLTKFHIVDNDVVRLMTEAEKTILIAEETQAQIEAENKRITDMDGLLQTDLSGMTLSRIDTAIDNIGNLNDAKVFLKRLARFIVKFIAR